MLAFLFSVLDSPFGTLVLPFAVSGLGCGSSVCAGAPRTVGEAAHGGASASTAAEETKLGLPTTDSSSPSADAAPSSRSPTTAEAGWLARVPFPLWGKGTIGVWGLLFCSFLFSSVLGERTSAKLPVAFASSAKGCSASAGVIAFGLDVGTSSAGSASPSAGASSSAGGRALSSARRRTARR